jgi:hypothetical protein
MLEPRCHQVVASGPGEFKEFFGNDGGDGVRIGIEGRVVTVSQSHEADSRGKEPETTTKNCH